MPNNKDVRQDILRVATTFFVRDGYTNTSTRKIAEQLDIKQPVIYYYFKNKVNLYREVLTAYSAELGAELAAHSQEPGTVEERIISMSLYLVNESHLNLSQMMHDTMVVFSHEDYGTSFKMWHGNYVAPFSQVFSELNNLRSDISLESIVRHYLRILTAYLNMDYARRSNQEIKETVAIFMRGISA